MIKSEKHSIHCVINCIFAVSENRSREIIPQPTNHRVIKRQCRRQIFENRSLPP